ncbi:MAG: AgmX/PglI C-terminal domain-containing protein [Archangium sp.]
MLLAGQSLNLASNGEVLPRADAPIRFDVSSGGRFEVGFVEGIVGEVMRNGETALSLGDVVHRGMASEADGGWSCELGRADQVRLGRGPVWLEAERVAAPAKARGGMVVDYRFLNVLLVCFAVFALGAMKAAFDVEAYDADDEMTSSDVARMRHILVAAEKPLPQKVQPTPEKVATKEPAKVNPAPGKPRPPSKPVRDTGGNNQQVAQNIAGRIFGGRGAAGIFGAGGMGKELQGAFGNVVAANGDGNGGWALKGDGNGGMNGDPERIGGIPRSGVDKRQGVGELCKGPGPCKKEQLAPPTWETEVSVCQAEGGGQCMDKELIRKVITSHRDQIRFCYEQALQTSPSLAGKVGVSFLVATGGSVPSAKVESSTVKDGSVGDCLVSRIRTWVFPVGKGAGGYRVTYPFVFKPSGG